MAEKEFYSRKDLAVIFGCCPKTIKRAEEEMRKLIPKGIYSKNDFAGTRIRKAAYQHYRNNRGLLKQNPKYVEPFVAGGR